MKLNEMTLEQAEKIANKNIEIQIKHLENEEVFLKNTLDNYWVKEYYKIINYLSQNGSVIREYNKLKISEFVKNERLSVGPWKYCRHHINEIKISRAIYSSHWKTNKKYLNDQTILITYDMHLFLHYIIQMANTTAPNNGMLVSFQGGFLNMDPMEYWNEVIKKYCQEFDVKYVNNWKTKFNKIYDKLNFDIYNEE